MKSSMLPADPETPVTTLQRVLVGLVALIFGGLLLWVVGSILVRTPSIDYFASFDDAWFLFVLTTIGVGLTGIGYGLMRPPKKKFLFGSAVLFLVGGFFVVIALTVLTTVAIDAEAPGGLEAVGAAGGILAIGMAIFRLASLRRSQGS